MNKATGLSQSTMHAARCTDRQAQRRHAVRCRTTQKTLRRALAKCVASPLLFINQF